MNKENYFDVCVYVIFINQVIFFQLSNFYCFNRQVYFFDYMYDGNYKYIVFEDYFGFIIICMYQCLFLWYFFVLFGNYYNDIESYDDKSIDDYVFNC